MSAATAHHPHAAVAAVEAEAAAARAGVEIEEVALPDEIDVLRAAMQEIWGPEVVAPRNLLRGMALGGGCLLVARPTDPALHRGRAVGFALGVLGWDRGVHLHSHQVGVVAELRAAGVGYALKLAQRAQALEHGITEMRWTYDPMLRANARFNLVRLGAEPIAFVPHCYGDRRDAFNTGDRTDRLEVSWRLDAAVGRAFVVAATEDLHVELPADYQDLRTKDAVKASRWRDLVGHALAEAIAAGHPIAMDERGYVVLGTGSGGSGAVRSEA